MSGRQASSLVLRVIQRIHKGIGICDTGPWAWGWAMGQQVCVVLSAAEREQLAAIAADRNRPRKHIERAQIVLASADRHPAQQVAQSIGVSRPTVWRWQQRFAESGIDGLLRDKTRKPGKAPIAAETAARVVAMACTEPPHEATHWTHGDGPCFFHRAVAWPVSSLPANAPIARLRRDCLGAPPAPFSTFGGAMTRLHGKAHWDRRSCYRHCPKRCCSRDSRDDAMTYARTAAIRRAGDILNASRISRRYFRTRAPRRAALNTWIDLTGASQTCFGPTEYFEAIPRSILKRSVAPPNLPLLHRFRRAVLPQCRWCERHYVRVDRGAGVAVPSKYCVLPREPPVSTARARLYRDLVT
jgi:hypothetical protein